MEVCEMEDEGGELSTKTFLPIYFLKKKKFEENSKPRNVPKNGRFLVSRKIIFLAFKSRVQNQMLH